MTRAEQRAALNAAGMCRNHPNDPQPLAPGSKQFCEACRDRQRAIDKASWHKRKAPKIAFIAPPPMTLEGRVKTRFSELREAHPDWSRERCRMRARLDVGACRSCGKVRPAEGLKQCSPCRGRDQKNQASNRAVWGC